MSEPVFAVAPPAIAGDQRPSGEPILSPSPREGFIFQGYLKTQAFLMEISFLS
jgi:hypothetical protein